MFLSAAISGQATSGTYSQAYSLGNFFIVLSLSGSPDSVNLELGRNTIAKGEEIVGQSPEIPPSELVEMLRKQLSDGLSLSLIIAKVENQKLTLSAIGEVEARLFRKGKVVNLLRAARNVAGPVLHDDLLVMGTREFFSEVKPTELLAWESRSAEEIRDQVLPKVESFEDDSRVAAIFVKVNLTATTGADEEASVGLAKETPEGTTAPYPKSNAALKTLFASFSQRRQRLFSRAGEGGELADGRSRKVLYLTMVALVVLVCFVAYQLRSRALETAAKSVAQIERQASEGMSTAGKLIGLNDKIAAETLMQTKKEVEQSIAANFGQDWSGKNFSEKKRLEEILTRLDGEINRSAHIYKIDKLDDFSDFALLKSGANITAAQLYGGEIVALDLVNGSLYTLSTKNKAAAIVGGDFKNGKYLDFSGDNIYVWTSGGIYLRKINSAANKQVIKAEEAWGEIKAMSFFGGNLYLLDSGNNQIWKHQGTEEGFAALTKYLKEGLSLTLSRGVAMQIDGYIYVLTASGEIVRLASGGPTNFDISGLPEEMGEISRFYVSDETENIYLWDSGKNRIIVVNKEGVYQALYQLAISNEQLSINSILADEEAKKIFLISGGKVYSIDIR